LAKSEFDALLAYNPPKDIRERHSKTYLRAKDYLKKIRERGDGAVGQVPKGPDAD
jgi:hypothetical protein